jgi:hypothetical protein
VSPANSKGLQPTRLPLQQSATEATWFHSFKSKYRGMGGDIVMPVSAFKFQDLLSSVTWTSDKKTPPGRATRCRPA